MFSNIRLQSDNITKFTSNEKAYDLYHSSINSYPSQFKSFLTDYHQINLSESKMKKAVFADFTEDYSHYPSVFTSTFSALPTQGFLDLTRKAFSVETTLKSFDDVYPIAVRWTNNKDLWLIERPPFQTKISFRNARSNSPTQKVHTFDIWVPWTLMLLQAQPEQSNYNAWLYFNDGPLNSDQDSVIPCFYPNMYNDARMCLNQTSVLLQMHLAETNKFDIRTIYNFIINDYMSGGWNLDLGISIFESIALKSNSRIKELYGQITDGYTNYRATKKVLSFLKLFSKLSLEDILSLVSTAKEITPIPFSKIYKPPHNYYGRINNLLDNLSQEYFYSDKYSDSTLIADTPYHPLLRVHGLMIESTYATTISLDNMIRKYRYYPDLSQKEVALSYQNFYANGEEFTNRMLDFFTSYYSQDISNLNNTYVDYKNVKENPFILVTKDSIDPITNDMPVEYFISKLTSQVPQNV